VAHCESVAHLIQQTPPAAVRAAAEGAETKAQAESWLAQEGLPDEDSGFAEG
jgi:hypothetical protein